MPLRDMWEMSREKGFNAHNKTDKVIDGRKGQKKKYEECLVNASAKAI